MRSMIFALAMVAAMSSASAATYDVVEKNMTTLQSDLASGRVTSADLVSAYLARIDAIDHNGPTLRSVLALNPNAAADARASDARRKAGKTLGPLDGLPILVKDNIETADPMATTAGSLALKNNVTGRDAPIVAHLRAAGVIILGKANLSEWANIRSSHSESGWSAIGGLVKNPYVLDRSACGSSSGSGAAVAASLSAAALGTETDGSLVCPGSLNGIVSLKPTLGLLSRTHIVPISHNQDTPGPMARTVMDAALLLTAMAGSDPADPATAESDAHKMDYAAALAGASLRGKRLGIVAPDASATPTDTDLVFNRAVEVMKAAGAEIVMIHDFVPPLPVQGTNESNVLNYDLKADLNTYLAGLPHPVGVKTLADIIAFNRASPREMALFGQDLFEAAELTKGLSDLAYIKARDDLKASSRGILDKLIKGNHLDALIRATDDPSFRVDIVKGDNDSSNSPSLPATAGYPHLTVPMGYIHELPVGLSFIGTAWTEKTLLQLGYAYEQVSRARQAPKFIPSLEATPEVERAFAPG